MASHSKEGKKKPRVVTMLTSAAAAMALAAAGIFVMAPAANAADAPVATPVAATATNAPATQDTAPAAPAAAPSSDTAPAVTSSTPAPAAPEPAPAPAASEPATPAGAGTPTGPTTTAGPATPAAAPAAAATPTPTDTSSSAPATAPAPAAKVTTQTSNNGGHQSKKEAVGIYLYKAKDATKAPSWGNSGDQTFCGSKDGSDWFTSLPCTLPPEVCGPGWDYQQDKVKYEGTFNWPSTIHPPVDNIGWPPLYDAKHGHLSELTTVPDCAPPKEHVSGNVTFTDTLCYANKPVSNGADVTLNGKTTATYTLNGGEVKALPAGMFDDSIIGQSGYPAVLHVVLTGEDGSTLVFDHTFAAPKSDSDCTPVTYVTPPGPVYTESTVCGVPGTYDIPGATRTGDSITATDPNGTVNVYSEYGAPIGGYNVTDSTTKDGVRTLTVLFIQAGSATINPEGGDYTIVTIDGIKYAQWTHTFTKVEACPVTTIIPTPPAPKVNAPTCTADGSLPPLQGGDGYTAAYNRKFDGPGKYTAIYTVSGDGVAFKEGKTVSYDLTVLGKLTENCPTSTPTPTPTPTNTTPPSTTTSYTPPTSGDVLAHTGSDITGPITWGIALLMAGLLLISPTRRRIFGFVRRVMGRTSAQ